MRRFAFLVEVIVLCVASPLTARATCGNSLLSGTYAGYYYGINPGGYRANSVIVLYFDGAGNYKSSWWGMQSGSFQSGTSNGTYSIGTNSFTGGCVGTLFPSGGTSSTFAVTQGGSVAYPLNQVSGANLSGVWTKQSLSGCSKSIVSGEYGGYSWGTNPGGAKDNNVNAWYFDGNGNFKSSFWGMQNGSYAAGTVNGTYLTATDSNTGACIGTFAPTGATMFQYFMIASGGSVLYPLNSVSGANNSEVLAAQSLTSCTSNDLIQTFSAYTWGTEPGNHLGNSVSGILYSNYPTTTYALSWWGMLSGSYQSGTSSGTWTPATDSNTGACMLKFNSGPITGALASDGNTVYSFDNTSGANTSNVQTKALRNCPNSTLSGTFGAYTWGTEPGGHLGNGVSIYYFDGVGNYKLSWWEMLSGSFQSGTGSGTYSISQDSNSAICVASFNGGPRAWVVTGVGTGPTGLYGVDPTSGANTTTVVNQQ